MKASTTLPVGRNTAFVALALSSLLLTSCASAPDSPQGAALVRSKLTTLQNDPKLADRARVEIREAETAVRLAEQPLSKDDAALGEHRVYMADQTVAIAEANATTRYTEDQRTRLGEERNAARLQARTQEVNQARADAFRERSDAEAAKSDAETAKSASEIAKSDAEAARSAAETARSDAEAAKSAANAAQSSKQEAAAAAALQAKEYQRQIDALQAEVTDRGVVLTLGDVLFATGSAELQGSANSNLNKLVSFLNEYPERSVQIEGHTDNVGSAEYNQGLSQRRADSVSQYLALQGIASQRLSTLGLGMDKPVTDNDSTTGRQQNRRVEIIVENPALTQ